MRRGEGAFVILAHAGLHLSLRDHKRTTQGLREKNPDARIHAAKTQLQPKEPGCTRDYKGEDLQDRGGLISVDRNGKATLPLTIPRPIQVVYKGSSPRNCPVGSGRQPSDVYRPSTDQLNAVHESAQSADPTGYTPATSGDRCRRFLAWILT